MSQSFPDIPSTTTLQDSLALILARDEACKTLFAGTAYPTADLAIGMLCYRTDLQKVYVLKNLTPTWVQIMDVTGATAVAPTASVLAASRTITLSGVLGGSAAFDGSTNITITGTLVNSGVTAGTYAKVTVNADGRITAGLSLTNADLPEPLSKTVIRSTATAQVSLASTDHGFQVGSDASNNVAIDTNSIQQRNAGAAGTLEINRLGGNVQLGDGSTTALLLDASINSASFGIATVGEAQAGSVNTKVMTPSRVATQLAARAYTSANQTITSGGTLTLAHGLGAEPQTVGLFLVCQTAESGYSIGAVVPVSMNQGDLTANASQSVTVDATNIVIRYSSSTNAFRVANATTGVSNALTNANWRLRVKATI